MQQHRNPYVTLIYKLIASPSEKVNELLQENTELLNINLVESIVVIAEQLLEAEDENGARYFFSIAQHLAQVIAEMELQIPATVDNMTQSCQNLGKKLNPTYLYAIDSDRISSLKTPSNYPQSA